MSTSLLNSKQIANIVHRAAQMVLGTPYAADTKVVVSIHQTGDVLIQLDTEGAVTEVIVPRTHWIKEITS